MNKLQGGSFSKGFVNAVKFAVAMTAVVAVGRWAVRTVGKMIAAQQTKSASTDADIVSRKGDSRGLTKGEEAIWKELFPKSNYDTSEVTVKHGRGYIGLNSPHVKGSTIYYPDGYVADYSAAGVGLGHQWTFAHELVHIYQKNVLGYSLAGSKLRSLLGDGYAYKYGETTTWNIENRADAIADEWLWNYHGTYIIDGAVDIYLRCNIRSSLYSTPSHDPSYP